MTDLCVGDSGPEVRIENISRVDFVKYAGASGDFNPVHYDDEYATVAGNKSVFAQGMLTAGIASTFLTEWFEIANISTFDIRFEKQVWPGDTLIITGEIVAIDRKPAEAMIDITLTGQTPDDRTVLTGSATIVD